MTKFLLLDGHPDQGRLLTHLLDTYEAALPPGTTCTRMAVRDLHFDANLKRGFAAPQPWEPDLARLATLIAEADHVVIAFPLWWGAEPAQLKGLLDRLFMPGFAFRYQHASSLWDKLLRGRSADLIVTMDTPPWFLRLVWGNPVGKRWHKQILGFCGFAPVRYHPLGMTRRGGAKRKLAGWEARLAKAARTAPGLRRGPKTTAPFDAASLHAQLNVRQS